MRRSLRRLLEAGGVQAESRTVAAAGTVLHYLEAGAGAPVALVQGAGGGAGNWFRILPRLAERFRVLALDIPGFGLSDAITPRAPLGIQMAEVLSGWLRAAGVGRCAVVGTSFGGLAALRLAQREPERVGRLVLLDAAGLGRELPPLVRVAAAPVLRRLLLRPSRGGTEWLFRHLLIRDRRSLDAESRDALVDYLFRSAAAGDPAVLARALRLFADWRGQREVLTDAELASLACPVLVVWGTRDAFLPPAHAERATRHIPDATLRWIPDAGHSPNWEAPDALLRVMLPFLEGRRPPQ
ncbi:MAG TPA: alpha/beta fold hydrolase [Longimicrobiales bacterium]